jgi:GalNAc5-diNAcBac-PP-undecaprenol beta-1,3-glucosyltransferase
MFDFEITVAIPTYNRSALLVRAIRSVLDQQWPGLRILVVDDGSSDDTSRVLERKFPEVQYLRQEKNLGCTVARNRALREAQTAWVLLLDDDDTLLPGAIERISKSICACLDREKFPVFQFARSNGVVNTPFPILRMEDYLHGKLNGDFTPVIQRELFLDEKLAYHEIRAGAEHLLWWKIAEKYGIPTWSEFVCQVHTDAPIRLTSARNQISNARDYVELQELTLSECGQVLEEKFPSYYRSKILGVSAYQLIVGDRAGARAHLLTYLRQHKVSGSALALLVISVLPVSFVRCCFYWYRRASGVPA